MKLVYHPGPDDEPRPTSFPAPQPLRRRRWRRIVQTTAIVLLVLALLPILGNAFSSFVFIPSAVVLVGLAIAIGLTLRATPDDSPANTAGDALRCRLCGNRPDITPAAQAGAGPRCPECGSTYSQNRSS